MKVLFVIGAFDKASGAEHVLIDFLKSTTKINPIFLFIGTNENIKNFFEDIISENNSYFLYCNSFIGSSLSAQIFLPFVKCYINNKLKRTEIVKKINNDISIDLIYFNNSSEAGYFYDLFDQKKYIVHIHDMINMFRKMKKRSIIKALKKANAVITASKAVKAQLIENGIQKEKIQVAYNSINFSNNILDYKIEDELNIGFVGSAIRRKGFDILVNIINALSKDTLKKSGIKKLSLFIITNTSLESLYLNKYLSLLRKDIEVVIKSNIKREEVFNLYKEISIVLIPSRFDPLPTVALEGIMSGTCVMGNRIDGIPEMLFDENLLFNINDVNEVCKKIYNWVEMNDKKRNNILSSERNYISSQFSSNLKKENIMNVINNVLLTGEKNE